MPRHSLRLTALACAAILSPLQALAQTPAVQPPPPGSPRVLRITGEGTVRARPDIAVLVAGVDATGPDLGRVTREAAARMRKILDALTEAGIAEKDVQTTRHDVQIERPWKDGRPGPISGYTVSDEVRVTVRNLERLGPAIDRVTAAGANSFRSLAFEKDDPTPEKARALAAAYGSARAKAEALARAAGVTIGEILQVAESSVSGPIPMMHSVEMRAASKSRDAGTPVSAGELEFTATVDVVYAIR